METASRLLSDSVKIFKVTASWIWRQTDGNFRELSGEEAWEAIENFAQVQKEAENKTKNKPIKKAEKEEAVEAPNS
ncbi:hypothetical protein Tco_0734773 [Tanacetum coccineum]